MTIKKKKASELFATVDPHLIVIDGGIRHKHRTNKEAWESSGGAICPRCGEETVRFRPEDGVCRQCASLLNVKEDQDKKKHTKFLRLMKAHNARIDKKKRRSN